MRRSTPPLNPQKFLAAMKLPICIDWKRPMIGLFACLLAISWAAAQQPAAQKPKSAPQNPQPKAEKADSAPPAAPANIEPPRAVPPVMTFTKELISEDESTALSKELQRDKYKLLFSNAVFNNDSKPVIAKWAKWRMHQMTIKANRRRLHELRNEMMQEISYAGRSKGVQQKQMLEFRYFMCDELTKRAAELLKNNFHVRLNAAIILAQLNLTEDDFKTPDIIEEQAYVKASLPLLEVLNAPTGGGLDEQLEAVKVQAAIGLGRINLLGPPGDLNLNIQNQNLRNLMAKTLIAQLQNPGAHPWYQKRLIDALASVDMVNDVSTGKPIIVQALGEILADRERDFCVRARAARGLGRCPLPPGLNIQKLVFQILLLENEMAQAYQRDPNAYHWLDCFQDLYFAFHPVSDIESQLYGNKRLPGLNQKNLGTLVQEAYRQLLPIVSHVVNQPRWTPPKDGEKWPDNTPIPNQMISDLAKWLQDHQPTDHKLAPSLPELAPASPVPTAKAGSTTSG